MLEQGEIERLALELYEGAGFDARDAVPPEDLVVATVGTGALRFLSAAALRHNAAVARVGAEWRIYIRRGLRPSERRFSIAHELAEWSLVNRGIVGLHVEQTADALAAALLAPKPFAARACAARGPRWRQLALEFGCTESCAALRYGEVTGRPVALVTPRTVRERGEPIAWPGDAELRAERKLPGLVKARLRDDPARFVVRKSG